MGKEFRELANEKPLLFMWMNENDTLFPEEYPYQFGFSCYDGDLLDRIVFPVFEIIQHNWNIDINLLFSKLCANDAKNEIISMHRLINRVISFEEITLYKNLALLRIKVSDPTDEYLLWYFLIEGEVHYEFFMMPSMKVPTMSIRDMYFRIS